MPILYRSAISCGGRCHCSKMRPWDWFRRHSISSTTIQSNLLIGSVWPDEQRFFFDHVMPAKDAWGAAFCCGTSSIIRIRALEDIGGFPTDSVTEDFLVTLELDRKGW